MSKKHYTIPFFITMAGCGHKCVFCDQRRITGEAMPDPESVPEKIERYLSTMPSEGARIEAGFFGGSFTGLSADMQAAFLDRVRPFLDRGVIHGIRLSTRPDLVGPDTVPFLSKHGVTLVELGVQSMSEEVLMASGRGHTVFDTERASGLIIEGGLELGHQMMLGLPGSGPDEELYTARRIRELGARQVRIYPALVIKGTALADMWVKNKYRPLPLDEAIERAARLILYFEANGVKVIRCGLHPSEGLISGEEYLAGPFHPSFGQKARERARGCV